MAFNNRGYAKYCLGHKTEALEDYDRALELNPRNGQAIYNRADIQIEMGEYESVLSNFSKLIERNPKDAHTYYARGYVSYKQKDFYAANEDYGQAINILMEEASHPLETRRQMENLHPLYQDETIQQDNALLISCYLMRGICFYYQKDMDKALEEVEKAIELNPQNKLAIYNRGFFHYQMGNLKPALADYEKAIELDSQYAYPYGGRGKCHFEQGNLLAALENFTHASELETTEHYALAGLAVTQHALGEIQNAQERWRTLLEKDERHRQPEWLAEEYGWNPPLVHEADLLTAELDGKDPTDSEAK
jgi:tetratricopeptide (TPR) repeat protein